MSQVQPDCYGHCGRKASAGRVFCSSRIKQRAWVENALTRYGLDDPTDNSAVPVGKPVPAYETLIASRPLKPPGRR